MTWLDEPDRKFEHFETTDIAPIIAKIDAAIRAQLELRDQERRRAQSAYAPPQRFVIGVDPLQVESLEFDLGPAMLWHAPEPCSMTVSFEDVDLELLALWLGGPVGPSIADAKVDQRGWN